MAGGVREASRAYRTLLRSISHVFKGDLEALKEGRQQAREQFLANRHVADAEELKQLIAMANEAAEFLRSSVVQARLNDQGNYEMTVPGNESGQSLLHPDAK